MIARSTIDTAVKIIRTEKPSYLFSKFVRNERNTAFLQPLRKGISSEGFINRSIGLLNKMGMAALEANTEKESKRHVYNWVKRNVEVKPKTNNKNIRFNREVQPAVYQVAQEDANQALGSQRRITQYFQRM